jgi:hypothetical protein
MLVFALDDAALSTIALVAIFFVVFPAFVTGLIVYAVVVARGESLQNEENRRHER